MSPAEQLLQDALRKRLGDAHWLFKDPDGAAVAIVANKGCTPVRRYQGRTFIGALADAYDDLETGALPLTAA